jgi:hypothetical protein
MMFFDLDMTVVHEQEVYHNRELRTENREPRTGESTIFGCPLGVSILNLPQHRLRPGVEPGLAILVDLVGREAGGLRGHLRELLENIR